MSTLAVIPARLGATRLPRKPLRLLAGAPLVIRVWERVRDLGIADRCVIATDHRDVAAAAHAAGAECVLTAEHHSSGTDRVAEVVARSQYSGFDVVLNVQGDEPFVPAAALTGALDMVRARGFALGTTAVNADPAILAVPSVVKVVCADDGRALYFSRAAIPYLRHESEAVLHRAAVRQHVGVYAYTPAALAQWVALPPHPLERIEQLEQLRPLAAGIAMGVALIDTPPEVSIDTEEDLERANRRWPDLIERRP